MRKKILNSCILIFFSGFLFAQNQSISNREIPTTFSDLSSSDELVEYLDSINPFLPSPAFGKFQQKPMNLNNAHIDKRNNHSVYSWKIKSPNFNIRILLDRLSLYNGDTLFTYSPNGELLETTAMGDNLGQGFVSIPSQGGMLLQLKDYSGSAEVNILGYSLELRQDNKHRADDFGDSFDCQVNVNCAEGEEHRDVQRSVVRILLKLGNSFLWCSGSVINNTNYDYQPYLLTAEHCGLIGSQLAPQSDIDLWTFYFNYESEDCTSPLNEGNLNSQRITGATVLANSDDNGGDLGSDFLLLKLSRPIPDSFNVYYSGWNRNGDVVPQKGVGIHHPTGDIKKISTFQNPLIDGSFGGIVPNTHWIVEWTPTVNGHGTTEGGSSGSPLFDENNLIRGVLTGGGSDCDNVTGPDLYGKFSMGWNSHGSESNRRLDVWLDPLNTGFLALNGANKGDIAPFVIDADLEIYPVPAAGDFLTLKNVGLPQDQIDIAVFDALGKLLSTSKLVVIPGEENTLDISGLKNGFYFIRIDRNGSSLDRKFIVSRN